MRLIRNTALTALMLTAVVSLPARAEPGDALDRALNMGMLESVVLQALARIDMDAAIHGFEQAAQAAADGRASADNPELARARGAIEQQMAQAGPQLARAAAGLMGPVLRAWRAELARDMVELGN